MALSIDEYDKKCEEVRKENAVYLDIFKNDLKGLSPKTIERHLANAEFYLNEFLLYSVILRMQDGVYEIGEFLGYYFIRKCMWSTPGTIKSTAASIKKFYMSMLSHRLIDSVQYRLLADTIKDNMKEWQKECARYNG